MGNKPKKKRSRLLLIIGGSLVAFIIIVLIAASHLGERMGEKYLRKFLAENPLKGHVISFEDIDVNVSTLSFAIHDVLVHPDTTSPLINNPDSLALMKTYYVKVEKVAVKRTRIWKLLRDKVAHIGLFYLKRPQIHMIMPNSLALKEYGVVDAHMPLAKENVAAPPPVEFIEAELLEIYEGSIEISERGLDSPVMKTTSYSLKIWDAAFDPADTSGFAKAVRFDDIKFNMQQQSINMTNGFYGYYIGELSLDYENTRLVVDTFKLVPKFNKPDFGYKFGKQTDRFDVHVDHLEVNDIKVDELMQDSSIHIGEIAVTGANVNIFRDKNVPRDMSIFPKYLSQVLLSLDIPLNIESLILSSTFLQYEEVAEGEPDPGIIFFEDLNLNASNITNIPAVIADNGIMKFEAEGMMYNKSKLNLLLDFSLENMNGDFDFSGSFSAMEMSEFNNFIKPAMNIVIHEGQLNKAVFNAKADKVGARGTLRFLYQDLNLVVLKKKQKDNSQKATLFFTDLANIAVRKHNPPKDKPDRVAIMTFTREPNKNFINVMAKTLINGITSTMLPGHKNIVAEGMENEENLDVVKSKSEQKAEKKEQKKREKESN